MKLFVTIIFLTALLSVTALADIIAVPGDQPTIQAGIDSASAGDTVLVADGTYPEQINFRGKAITVASHFILDGDTSHIAATSITGSTAAHPDSGSVVYFISGEDTTSILSGLSVSGGSGTVIPPVFTGDDRAGGGIYCFNSGAKITHCRISGNQISGVGHASGGGIFASAFTDFFYLVVTNSEIRNNTLNAGIITTGGGLMIGIRARLADNKILHNTSTSQGDVSGGALLANNFFGDWGAVRFSGNLVAHNQSFAGTAGSALAYFVVPEVTVRGNIIRNNSAGVGLFGWGAGLGFAMSDGLSLVEDNTILYNQAVGPEQRGGGLTSLITFGLRIQHNHIRHNQTAYGGGIATWFSSPVIMRNLIARNKAAYGGGIWLNRFPFAAPAAGSSDWRELKRALIELHRLDELAERLSPAAPQIPLQDPPLLNNTIADNSADIAGGGLHIPYGAPLMMNNLIWGNSAPADSQIAGAALVQYSDVQGGYSGLGNRAVDPIFTDSVYYYLHTQLSPVVDAGNPNPVYNDTPDPLNPGLPLWPALGGLRNDMGAYGGHPSMPLQVSTLFGPQFRAFVERVNGLPSPQRPAVVDSFMNAVPAFPFIEEGNVAYFLYRGTPSSINLAGDMNGWTTQGYAFSRLADTDLWYWEDAYEADARLDYKFVLNGSTWILDPLNPRQVSGGFGPNSELAMPGYIDPPEILNYPAIPHGSIEDTLFHSNFLNNSRTVRIYLPPSYDPAGSDSFPVALFHDGGEYLTLGSAKNVLDYLIAEQRIQPLIAVFVPPVNRDNEYAFTQTVPYTSFILQELMPYVDGAYRTRHAPDQRLMAGLSFGGLITTEICYGHPEAFGLLGLYSPAYWPKDGEVINNMVGGPVKDLKIYMDWGTYEASILLDGQQLKDILPALSYEMTWYQWHEGHSWGSWRAHLDLSLEYFFPGSALGIDETAILPQQMHLAQNYPNPFNPETVIRYQLSVVSDVKLEVYNLLGQKIATLIDARQGAGEYRVRWDGRDRHGSPVGSGVYFYRLSANGNNSAATVQTRKMILLR